jgi:hypothetical protein
VSSLDGAARALIATVLVEVPIVVAFHPHARWRAFVLAVLANVVTNSLLNRIWFAVVPWPAVALVSGEALSFAVEAFVYARGIPRVSRERAIAASATANLGSFVVGPLVMALLPLPLR